MKILLVLTGGTIGSACSDGIIGTDSSRCRIAELYREKYGDEVSFYIRSPVYILSENLNVHHWEILVNYILSEDISGYDGIIITHGSDTLAYSSAMLAFCLGGIGKPVVITAADKVPDDPDSNALDNFRAAVNIISHAADEMKQGGGVYTVYRNHSKKGSAEVFVPTRLVEADRLYDKFSVFGGSPLGVVYEDGKICCSDEGSKNLLYRMAEKRTALNIRSLSFEKRVLMLHPYPSIDYENIIPGEDIGAVLHITYHSSTISEDAAVLAERCRQRNIPLFLCSFKNDMKAVYDTSKVIIDMGAVPLYNISNEAAYAKLLLGVNLYPENICGFMDDELYFEYSKEV